MNRDQQDETVEATEKKEKKKLMDHVHDVMRREKYSPRTEGVYSVWIFKFIQFHGMKHPLKLGIPEIEAYLAYLASDEKVAPATQNQALNAILFLYNHVLKRNMDGSGITIVRYEKIRELPVVLTRDEVDALFSNLKGRNRLMAELIYGAGLRLRECLLLRIKDLDFSQGKITVCKDSGEIDRVTFLPDSLARALKAQVDTVGEMHARDVEAGAGGVHFPDGLAGKRVPTGHEKEWQYVFSADTGSAPRAHIHESTLQKAVKRARKKAGIGKKVSPHTLRHSFAFHLLLSGAGLEAIRKLLGHKDISTTMIYIHILKDQGSGKDIKSPLDF